MPDIRFICPRCKQKLVIDAAGAEMTVGCPTCQHMVIVPKLNQEDRKSTQRMLPFDYHKRSSLTKPASQSSEAHRKAA
jgi:DNA-directed RNA polymerase subunit RPC12/RpoP